MEQTRVGAGDLDLNREDIARQEVLHAIRPFDECDAIACEEFIQPEIEELTGIAQSVGVAVPEWNSPGVLLDQREGRAGDRFGGDSQRGGNCFDEQRLASTEVSDESHDRAGREYRSEPLAQLARVGLGVGGHMERPFVTMLNSEHDSSLRCLSGYP